MERPPPVAITVCGQVFLVKFLVAACEPRNGILGTDVLQPLRAVVDVGTGKMWTSPDQSRLQSDQAQLHESVATVNVKVAQFSPDPPPKKKQK